MSVVRIFKEVPLGSWEHTDSMLQTTMQSAHVSQYKFEKEPQLENVTHQKGWASFDLKSMTTILIAFHI